MPTFVVPWIFLPIIVIITVDVIYDKKLPLKLIPVTFFQFGVLTHYEPRLGRKLSQPLICLIRR